jgi:type I restriction enzyme R subunit
MIVDRNELESQLFRNLDEAGLDYVEATSKRDLKAILKADRRGLIVSMLHKFEDIDANICTRDNFFVLVDEAHRSTGGDLGNYLMGALPKATYLGFTGTPIDRTAHGKGTFKVFGFEDEKGYLDKYSIRESVEDGTTVPLHYSLAPNDLRVDRETLEKEFLDLAEAEGISDIEELNKVLERTVTLKNMLKNEERIDKVARFVAEHYRSNVEPMAYKAFLVAVDREACVLYKEALDKYLPPDYSEVVISSQGKESSKVLQNFKKLTEDQEQTIRRKFRDPDEKPKILIVTEKLLTGFDAPVLYCMYLDKPMRDHVLLQAIARVNRPYEDSDGRRKPAGFVLDFVGIFEKLEKALAFDSQDVAGVIDGLDVLKERFSTLMAEGRVEYIPIPAGKKGDKAAEAVLEHFRDKEVRETFYGFYQELEELHEIISPDVFMRPFLPDYATLSEMYQLVRTCYDRDVIIDKSFLRKTAQLVREHTSTTGIKPPTKVKKLTSETLEAIANGDQPDTVKVFNLLKAIHDLVQEDALGEPYLISIGDKAEQIAQAFEERQKTTEETLQELRDAVEDIKAARGERAKSNLTPEAFAVFWLLRKAKVEKADEAAHVVGQAFEQYPHWRTSGEQEREVRKAFYKALIDAEVEDFVELAQNTLRMLRRATS